MKRYVHKRSTIDMLDAFQDKLDDLSSCDKVSASDDYDELDPDLEDIDLDEYDTPYYMLVDRKDVRDSDGFWTKYSLYRYWPFERYVTVFGDPDIYTPDDGDFDAEFDSEAEAYEWFEDYNGFEDDDVFGATEIDDNTFFGVPLKTMKFYYNDKIDPDVYPTFMHWMSYLKENNLWCPPEDER